MVNNSIAQATATIIVTPYTVTFDTNPHTATGTATGVGGANLSNDLDLSGTTHTNAGTYNGDAWSFTDPTGNYRSASGTVNDVINSARPTVPSTHPPHHPVIIGEQPLFSRKTNKKGRPVGKPVLAGFEFEFSSPLNPASATNSANYQVDNVTEKRVKKKVERILEPITKFNVSYSNDAVTIALARRETFKTGGRSRSSIVWRASGPHWQEPRCSRSPSAGRASRRRDRVCRVGLADDGGRFVPSNGRKQERSEIRTACHVPPDGCDGPVGPSFGLAQNPYRGPGPMPVSNSAPSCTITTRSSGMISSRGINLLRCDRRMALV